MKTPKWSMFYFSYPRWFYLLTFNLILIQIILFNMTHTTIFPSLLFPFLFSPSLGRRNFEDTRALSSVKMIFSLGAEKNHVSRAFGLILPPLVATHAQVLCTRTRYLGSFCFCWLWRLKLWWVRLDLSFVTISRIVGCPVIRFCFRHQICLVR